VWYNLSRPEQPTNGILQNVRFQARSKQLSVLFINESGHPRIQIKRF
jgi:hypothetical protein